MTTTTDIGTLPHSAAQPVDRAWSVLIGACLCMFCGTPAVIYYTFGIFVPEIIADTGWSATAMHGAIAPGALIVAIMAPFVGRLSDRFGARPLVLIGGPTFGIGIAMLGVGPVSAGSFTVFTVLMFALSFAGTPIIYAHAMTNWFDKRRGMAIGLIFAAGALGIAVWPSYAAALIEIFGWRSAYAVMGATAGVTILLSGLFLLRNPPVQRLATASIDAVPGLLARDALKTSRFWKIAIVFTLMSAVLGGMAVQFPVVLRKNGADPQTAAAILSVIGLSMLGGRLLLGFLLDRFFAPHLTIGIALISIASFALLMTSSSPAALIGAAALLGFGLGSEYAEVAYIVSRAFGLRAFGAIYGFVTLATGIGLAAGPAAIGISLVSGVATTIIYGSAIAVLVASIVVLITFRRADLPFGAPKAT